MQSNADINRRKHDAEAKATKKDAPKSILYSLPQSCTVLFYPKVGPAQARIFARWLISPRVCVLLDHRKSMYYSLPRQIKGKPRSLYLRTGRMFSPTQRSQKVCSNQVSPNAMPQPQFGISL